MKSVSCSGETRFSLFSEKTTNEYGAYLFNLPFVIVAFTIGLSLSESSLSRSTMHEFLRIRGLFSFLFFVAAGLLFDVDFFRQHWSTILLVVCLLAVGKGLILWLTTYLVDLRGELPRVAALGLFQIGELAVVLAWLGWKSEALTADIYALLIAVILPLMILTPLALRLTPALFKTSSIAPK